MKMKKLDIIKESVQLRKRIIERIKELGLSYPEIIKDAKMHGIKITKSVLSYYFNKDKPCKGYPSSYQIVWLAFRYCIDISLEITKLEFDDKKGSSTVKILFNENEENEKNDF